MTFPPFFKKNLIWIIFSVIIPNTSWHRFSLLSRIKLKCIVIRVQLIIFSQGAGRNTSLHINSFRTALFFFFFFFFYTTGYITINYLILCHLDVFNFRLNAPLRVSLAQQDRRIPYSVSSLCNTWFTVKLCWTN